MPWSCVPSTSSWPCAWRAQSLPCSFQPRARCWPLQRRRPSWRQTCPSRGRSRSRRQSSVFLATRIDVFGQAAQHANHDYGDGNPAEPLDVGYRSDHRDDNAGKTHHDGEFIGTIAALHKVIHANCLSFDMLHAFIPDLEQGDRSICTKVVQTYLSPIHQDGAKKSVPNAPITWRACRRRARSRRAWRP